MARPSKPYYRKAQRWVCTIDGRRVMLGESKDEALDEFNNLIGIAFGTSPTLIKEPPSFCPQIFPWIKQVAAVMVA